MNKSYLAKDLAEATYTTEKKDDKHDIEDGQYKIYKSDYDRISNNLKNNEYFDVPNYYTEACSIGYFKNDKSRTYSDQLNQLLWYFLLFNKKSGEDFKILNEAICIYNSENVLIKMDKSEKVLEFVRKKGYDTYLSVIQYFSDLYGVDVEEYRVANRNGSDIDRNFSPNKQMYNTTNTDHITLSIISENKETIFDNSGIVDEKKFEDGIKKRVIFPVYTQNYTLPELQILKSNKVGFEFNILDNKKDIIKQLNKIYCLEKEYKRTVFSSTKQEFLRLHLSDRNEKMRFESINAIKKSFVIYQYRQHCNNLEEARLLYNFHILFTNFEEKGLEDPRICLYSPTPSEDKFLYIEKEYLITEDYLTKEITQQINIITSMLNLKDS